MASFRELIDLGSGDLYDKAKEAGVENYTDMNKTAHAAALADEQVTPGVLSKIQGKKSEVKSVCEERGLSTSGKKADLQNRVIQDMLSGQLSPDDSDTKASDTKTSGSKPDKWEGHRNTDEDSALARHAKEQLEADLKWVEQFPEAKYKDGYPRLKSRFKTAEKRQQAIMKMARRAAMTAVKQARSFTVVENLDPDKRKKLEVIDSNQAREPSQVPVVEVHVPYSSFPHLTERDELDAEPHDRSKLNHSTKVTDDYGNEDVDYS